MRSARLTAAILAGGRGTRLGGVDKSALVIDGQRLIDRQLAVLGRLADHLLIVATQPGRFAALGVPVVSDLVPDSGALGGLHTAISAASSDLTLVVACDMPFLTEAFLQRVVEGAGPDVDAAVPCVDGRLHPLAAAYRRTCLPPLARRLEARRLRVVDFLSDVTVRQIGQEELTALDPDGTVLFNVNTPDDVAVAAALADRVRRNQRLDH
jgi:molybdopterin-guanine dinucleotide biosynthesis protein A